MAKDDDDDQGRSPGWWDPPHTPRKGGGDHHPRLGRRQSGRGSCLDWILGMMFILSLVVALVVSWLS